MPGRLDDVAVELVVPSSLISAGHLHRSYILAAHILNHIFVGDYVFGGALAIVSLRRLVHVVECHHRYRLPGVSAVERLLDLLLVFRVVDYFERELAQVVHDLLASVVVLGENGRGLSVNVLLLHSCRH